MSSCCDGCAFLIHIDDWYICCNSNLDKMLSKELDFIEGQCSHRKEKIGKLLLDCLKKKTLKKCCNPKNTTIPKSIYEQYFMSAYKDVDVGIIDKESILIFTKEDLKKKYHKVLEDD